MTRSTLTLQDQLRAIAYIKQHAEELRQIGNREEIAAHMATVINRPYTLGNLAHTCRHLGIKLWPVRKNPAEKKADEKDAIIADLTARVADLDRRLSDLTFVVSDLASAGQRRTAGILL